MTTLPGLAPSPRPNDTPSAEPSPTTMVRPEHDQRPPFACGAAQHALPAHPTAPPRAHASQAPRQPLRVLHRAGRKGHVAEPLPGHPAVPDMQEQNAAATRSHELSLMRLPSTYDIPWHQRHAPLQVDRCAAVRVDMRWNDTSTGDDAARSERAASGPGGARWPARPGPLPS
ncbi:hypothetical protein M8A51_18115 [Schlegelella sp. S2-27]|uniref:Uncharacterized protein n=1 Tax=Caldimonas mangrovi TaxID=2944811 RepID=A0ABT0YRT9_9BURK|nr:hypothetical protein [Caldimonas mangrovi]MCM5681447.1 hypothetical protein [Caldimonas mangrovi]